MGSNSSSVGSYPRIVFCRYYRGVANPNPCVFGLFCAGAGSGQRELRDLAKATGCILEYRPYKRPIKAEGTCSRKEYPRNVTGILYHFSRGQDAKEKSKN